MGAVESVSSKFSVWLNKTSGSVITSIVMTALGNLGSTFVIPIYRSFLSDFKEFLSIVIILNAISIFVFFTWAVKQRWAYAKAERYLLIIFFPFLVAFLYSYFYCGANTFKYMDQVKVRGDILLDSAKVYVEQNGNKPEVLFRHFHHSEKIWADAGNKDFFIHVQIIVVAWLMTILVSMVVKVLALKLVPKQKKVQLEAASH